MNGSDRAALVPPGAADVAALDAHKGTALAHAQAERQRGIVGLIQARITPRGAVRSFRLTWSP